MGNWLAVGLGVGVGLGAAVALRVAVALCVTVAVAVVVGRLDGLTVALVPVLGETDPAVPVAVAETVIEGVKVGTVGEEEDDVQPEITPEATMVKVPQPMAVSRTLSAVPAMVARTFIEPPRAPGRTVNPFPVPASENRIGTGKQLATRYYPGGPKAGLPKHRQA